MCIAGIQLHFEMSPWAAAVRRTMVAAGWPTGQLLVRAAHGYGMAEAAVIECLASGCSGVWAGGSLHLQLQEQQVAKPSFCPRCVNA